MKKITRKIFFNNIGLTCNFAELIMLPSSIAGAVAPPLRRSFVIAAQIFDYRYLQLESIYQSQSAVNDLAARID